MTGECKVNEERRLLGQVKYLLLRVLNLSVLPACRDVDAHGDRSFGQIGERRLELHRSQTLPRNIGAQARRSIFERLDSEASSR